MSLHAIVISEDISVGEVLKELIISAVPTILKIASYLGLSYRYVLTSKSYVTWLEIALEQHKFKQRHKPQINMHQTTVLATIQPLCHLL